ncbi:MAG: Eco57I restriction-modification methylase domain-containing protein [candidate division NC10 bacterium]|nr:Eco57I restriction-modification methylase domain-containing protein [candidate division NC10 bacterium]
MPSHELQQIILDLLNNLRGLEPLRRLIWSELNYDRVNQPLSRSGWSEAASKALAEDPLLFARHGDFHVIYARLASDRLLMGSERLVINRLLRDHPYALFLISTHDQSHWHFVNVKYTEDPHKRRLFRRITVGPNERLRTASERIAMVDISSLGPPPLSPLTIQERHDHAFDVEAVTNAFFAEYQSVFADLQEDLYAQTQDRLWAHDCALQFLNRIMFLYFVQRKRWLGNDPEFVRTFWQAYQHAGQPADTFFDRWLGVLFFEAFNNRFQAGRADRRHFPEPIRQALALAPYLNGGLFSRNRLDDGYPFQIGDSRIEQVLGFLERYNFTIAEDTPLDQEVAVDPEMVGKVYESLVNVSDQVDERGSAGIFYTPRTEIALMCRLALVDHLANHLGEERRPLLYDALFAFEEEEKRQANEALARENLWPKLERLLREVTVLDPAVGSGSFLVGMLSLLSDLSRRANAQLGHQETDYEMKKRIIGQSLYGVDVMPWAVDVCELRLWLQLVIDTELQPAELKFRPLLPNLSFKIRCGDSLVQEVGGLNLAHIKPAHGIPSSLRGRLTQLKGEKLKFYNNDPACKYRSEPEVFQEELRLFREILDARQLQLGNEIKALKRKIEGPQEAQIRLDGTIEVRTHQMELRAAEWQRQLEQIQLEAQNTDNARLALRTAKDMPFVWDVAFVEIFEGNKEGFDIVIGNPPYVRQEKIADPKESEEDRTLPEHKKAYKANLARSVYTAYPRFFGYKPAADAAIHKIDAKSDLYIYFYFHGLSLLNPKGSFCFITSNSWLDVGYGSDLQEFLLKHCQVKMILDNQVKRSFSQADVNTIIALLSAPDERREWGLDQIARFVMFTAPFEQVLSPVIFEEIEEATERKRTPEYRVFPISQRTLLIEGCAVPEEAGEEQVDFGKRSEKPPISRGPLIQVARYIGNKWGGKYLRAPEIYWTILEKGKDKLVRLGDIAEVRFGIKTGANDFFYLDEQRIREWGIEEEFLKPVIKSPRECKRILIDPEDLRFKVFMCHREEKELKGTAALEYIRWGEARRFHRRPSCAGRATWWAAPNEKGNTFWGKEVREKIAAFVSRTPTFADCRLYCSTTEPWMHAALNSTLVAFFGETMSRDLGGGGGPRSMMVYEVQDLWIPKQTSLSSRSGEIAEVFQKLGTNHLEPFLDDVKQNPNRRALDSIIFDALGLTQGEREAVYEAVIELVEARLKKAESLNPRSRHRGVASVDRGVEDNS